MVPMKSQHLHKFSLPCLKWGHKNQASNGNHRFGESPQSIPESPTAGHVNASEQQTRFTTSSCSTQRRDAFVEGVGVDESSGRQWNLRPRRPPVSREPVEIGTAHDDDDRMVGGGAHAIAPSQTENQPKSTRLRGFAVGGRGVERKVKKKFWIALSKEEIEEDIYAMTGSKPSRKPKKRPKNVQKQLDSVFPGLNFNGLSSDSYRVYQSMKR